MHIYIYIYIYIYAGTHSDEERLKIEGLPYRSWNRKFFDHGSACDPPTSLEMDRSMIPRRVQAKDHRVAAKDDPVLGMCNHSKP